MSIPNSILYSDSTGTLPISKGGTGTSTANGSLNALLPSQSGNGGKFLTTNGSNASWATVSSGSVNFLDTVPLGLAFYQAVLPNTASFVKVYAPNSFSATQIFFHCRVATGSPVIECGVYDSSKNKLNTGTMTLTTTGINSVTLTSPISITANTEYYLALLNRNNNGCGFSFFYNGGGTTDTVNFFTQGSLSVLPSTASASPNSIAIWLRLA